MGSKSLKSFNLCIAILLLVNLLAGASASSTNKFVIISDTQNIDGVDQMCREIIDLKPPFVICVGDMPSALDPRVGLFRRLREAGIEVHNAMGNHDGGVKAAFRQALPPYPMNSEIDWTMRFVVEGKFYYSFNRGGIHFVIVDTCTDDKEAEYKWLEDDLIHHVNNPNKYPTILFMHYPEWMLKSDSGGGPIYQILASHPNEHTVKYSFAGHTHKLIPYPPEQTLGIPHYALYPSAPFGESVHTEYIIATVEPDKITFTRKAVLDKGWDKDFVFPPMLGKFKDLSER
jgi:hypothetical protein